MVQLTADNFKTEAEDAALPVLIEFSGEGGRWEPLEKQLGDRYKFCRVNPEQERELTDRFHLLGLPASVILHRGRIIQRIRGVPENPARVLESGEEPAPGI